MHTGVILTLIGMETELNNFPRAYGGYPIVKSRVEEISEFSPCIRGYPLVKSFSLCYKQFPVYTGVILRKRFVRLSILHFSPVYTGVILTAKKAQKRSSNSPCVRGLSFYRLFRQGFSFLFPCTCKGYPLLTKVCVISVVFFPYFWELSCLGERNLTDHCLSPRMRGLSIWLVIEYNFKTVFSPVYTVLSLFSGVKSHLKFCPRVCGGYPF